ncbi:MAG: CBS domain-containing protein [Erysipelotrichaceae bacterium]
MDNANKFIDAFVRIEKRLKEIASINRYLKFHQLVDVCSKKNIVVKNNFTKLLDYADLRNVLIHQRDDNNEILAQPTDNTVKNIENIADLLEQDKKALDFASKPVKIVGPSDSVYKAFDIMEELDSTKIPVYSNKKFVNLLTMDMVARWAISGCDNDKIEYLIDCKDCTHRVIFFDEDRSLLDVIRVFEDYLVKGVTLSAILITKNGKDNELPKGIITVYDLPKIMTYIL